VADGTISIAADPDTYAYITKGIYGPNNGITYHLKGFSRTGSITPDGKTIILNGGADDVMDFQEPLASGDPPPVAQNICNGSYVLIWQNDER
jgi:hypothetical protein